MKILAVLEKSWNFGGSNRVGILIWAQNPHLGQHSNFKGCLHVLPVIVWCCCEQLLVHRYFRIISLGSFDQLRHNIEYQL